MALFSALNGNSIESESWLIVQYYELRLKNETFQCELGATLQESGASQL